MNKTNNVEISPQTLVLVLLAAEVGVLPFFFGGASMTGRLVATIDSHAQLTMKPNSS